MTRIRILPRTLALAAVATLAAVGTAWATIPGADGVITACIDNGSGIMRAIDAEAGEQCRADETTLEWEQKGGGAPSYLYERVEVNGGSPARVLCPSGMSVSGGGGVSLDNTKGLTQNHPVADKTGTFAWGNNAIGWQVASEGWGPVVAFVVCAS